MGNNYDASQIKILKGLEAVRKRPGMYIGSTDVNGLHHLVWEIVDNAMDEVLANYAKNIKVTLKKDHSVIVEDDGRGIPVDLHTSGRSALEVIFTELHAGGKFSSDGAYKVAGGLHGVGSSVVNALSSKLDATVYKGGFQYETTFLNGGQISQPTHQVGPSSKRGTKIHFYPDYNIFKRSRFNFSTIAERLRESSFLIAGVKITIKSEIDQKTEVFNYQNGITAFIEFINQSKKVLHKTPQVFRGQKKAIALEISFQYTHGYNETIISFVNNVKTKEGGSHISGFKNAWTKTINSYARTQGLLKAKEANLEGSDVREGLTAIISLKIPEDILEFVGQTKDRLGTPIAKIAVEELLAEQFQYWLIEHKATAQLIIEKAKKATQVRQATRRARNEARKTKSTLKERKILSGKLTPAQSKDKTKKELFLVEGASAGGSAKLGRDKKYQAILPLRGKVINTEKAKMLDVLKNEEIATMINTIGAGIGADFKLSDAQYAKVIIMTDADTDGAHIQTLILTFLFRYMRPLVAAGMVYVAQPPLFKINQKVQGKTSVIYAWDEAELAGIIKASSANTIQRYKGLGEMNADQLWTTTMDPKERTLIKITLDDTALIERRVSTLMGEKVEPRKDWINKNIIFTLEDEYQI